MAQFRATAGEFYNDLDRDIHGKLGKEFKALDKTWTKIYDIKTSKKQQELITGIVGMGDAQEKPEGQAFATDIIQAGYSRQFLHTSLGLAFEVTMEAQEDDRYDVISDYAKWLMFGMNV